MCVNGGGGGEERERREYEAGGEEEERRKGEYGEAEGEMAFQKKRKKYLPKVSIKEILFFF